MYIRFDRRIVVFGICFAVVGSVVAPDSRAQSGLEAGRELSGQKPPDFGPAPTGPLPDLSKNPIDTTPDSTNPLPSMQGTPTPAPVPPQQPRPTSAAVPLVLMNCSGKPLTVKTFNATDTVMWVPYEARPIPHAHAAQLRCATRERCKLMIDGTSVKTGVLTGYQVFIRGGIKPTNDAAMKAGCGAQ